MSDNTWHDWEFVDEFELSEPCYSFDLCRILFDGEKYRIGFDSGCSCPSPFESHTADDFEPFTAAEAVTRVRAVHTDTSCSDQKRYAVEAIKKHAAENGVR